MSAPASEGRPPIASVIITGLLLTAIVAYGAALRLKEPLSSPALGAEDPYSHVVFTKEALERGWFGDSWYLGTEMYPPGLHALGGAIAPLSGLTLYDFARWSPVVFGALAIVGTYVLARRLAGPTAGLVAGFVTAVMPEHIFRTNLYFPTALDLAVLPAFLFMMYMTAEGDVMDRRRAALLTMGASIPLAFTHPWAVPLFVAPAFAALLLRAAREGRGWRTLVEPAIAASVASAFAMASRWSASDTGFSGFFARLPVLRLLSSFQLPAPLLFVALVAVIGAAAAAGVILASALGRVRVPRVARIIVAVIAAILLVDQALRIGYRPHLPSGVNFLDMMGYVPIVLALVGLAMAFIAPTPAGDMGLALGLVLYPLTAFDVFQSPFWPQRTAAYLCIAIALLAASAVSRPVQRALIAIKSVRLQRAVAPIATVCVILLVAGGVAAHPAAAYPWYHLYSDDDFHAFERTAGVLANDPSARVVVYTWQPALMVKTLASPSQAWYSPQYFKDQAERDKVASQTHGRLYVVYDTFTKKDCDKGTCDAGFLNGGGYHLVYRSASGTFSLYEVNGR